MGYTDLFSAGLSLIDKLFPDKIKQQEQRDQAQLALLQMQQNGELELTKAQTSTIIAEASSADKWTSRARPSFMYVMYILILMAIPMGFLTAFKPLVASAVAEGLKLWLTAIPDSLYTLFGVGYLGYTGARTLEKRNGTTK